MLNNLFPCGMLQVSITNCIFGIHFIGNACRDKVRRYLKVKFATLSDAEDAFNINYFHDDELFGSDPEVTTSSTPVPFSRHRSQASPMLAFSPLKNSEERKLPGSVLDIVSSGFGELTKRQRQQLLVHLFHAWLKSDVHQDLNSHYVPRNFLPFVASALKVLFVNGKGNVLYDAACCFGEMRPGEECPRMPLNRLPFGLISHNLKFFASDDASFLEAPPDYKSWCQSMYTLFGNKWAAMHNGPMWSYIDNIHEQEEEAAPCAGQQSDILTQALQQTFQCDSALLQQLIPENISAAASKEATENFMCPEVSQSLSVPGPLCTEPTENIMVPEVSPAVNVSCQSSVSETPTSSSTRTPSSLWSSLSESQRRENEGSSLTESELSAIHGIVPQSNSHGAWNFERNSLKVFIIFDLSRLLKRQTVGTLQYVEIAFETTLQITKTLVDLITYDSSHLFSLHKVTQSVVASD